MTGEQARCPESGDGVAAGGRCGPRRPGCSADPRRAATPVHDSPELVPHAAGAVDRRAAPGPTVSAAAARRDTSSTRRMPVRWVVAPSVITVMA